MTMEVVGNKCCLICRADHGNSTHDEIVALIRKELCGQVDETPLPRSYCKSCGKAFTNGGSLMSHEDPSIECINKMEQRVYAKVQAQERARYEVMLNKERERLLKLILAAGGQLDALRSVLVQSQEQGPTK